MNYKDVIFDKFCHVKEDQNRLISKDGYWAKIRPTLYSGELHTVTDQPSPWTIQYNTLLFTHATSKSDEHSLKHV